MRSQWITWVALIAADFGCSRDDASIPALGPITHVLPTSRTDAWSGVTEGGVYRVTTGDPALIQYYFLDPTPGSEGQRTISVDIAIESAGEGTRGGLIYGVMPNPTTYYLYLLEPDGRIVLFQREPSTALTEVWSGRVERTGTELVTLGLQERDGALLLLTNGVEVHTVRSELVGRGGVGIALGGSGGFAFTRFRHEPEPLVPGQGLVADDGAQEVPTDWREHEMPGVFSLSHPRGWRVSFDAGKGYVEVAGGNGEHVYIWPVYSARPLDRSSASALLGWLANQLVPGARWTPQASLADAAVRMEARDGERTTVASMRWVSNQSGSAAFCYVSSAPEGRYSAQAETIARVLASFRPVLDEPESAGDGRAQGPSLSFVGWRDPAEGAFQVEIPDGWRVDGGLQRHTALDYRRGVNLTSPDGAVNVFLMDPGIPSFTLPDSTTTFLGMSEGSWYQAPDGTRMLIRRYVSGSDFAREYAAGRFSGSPTEPRIVQQRDRPDLAAIVEREHAAMNAAAAGFLQHSTTAGEVFFAARRDGSPYTGYVAATTVLAASQIGGVWQVRELFGLVAPEERVAEAAAVLERLVGTFMWNAQWYLRQHQIQADVNRIMQEHNRRMTGLINGTFASASQSADRAADRFSEHIRGSVTVQNEQGEQFEVWNTSNYYWMDVFRDVAGTSLQENPDPSRFRELIVVQ